MTPTMWPFITLPPTQSKATRRAARLTDLDSRMEQFLIAKRSSACDEVIDLVEASRTDVRRTRAPGG